MRTIRTFLRVADVDGVRYLFNATQKQSHAPILDSRGLPYPTIAVQLVLNFADDAFDPAVAVLEANIPKAAVEVAMEVRGSDAI